MSERMAAGGYAEGDRPRPEDDDEEMHWTLELLGEVAVYLVVASLVVSLAGLTALALGATAVGRTVLAAGAMGAMASMGLAALVGTFSGMLNPFD